MAKADQSRKSFDELENKYSMISKRKLEEASPYSSTVKDNYNMLSTSWNNSGTSVRKQASQKKFFFNLNIILKR